MFIKISIPAMCCVRIAVFALTANRSVVKFQTCRAAGLAPLIPTALPDNLNLETCKDHSKSYRG